MGDSQGLFMVALGSAVLPWLGLLLHGLPLEDWGPKRLSASVSLSLESLDNTSGCLEAVVARMLETREKNKREYV